MRKSIILCADDFGFSSSVSKTIITLIKLKRISATSCMTNMSDYENCFSELLNYKTNIDIGLHFNLTDGNLLSTGQPSFTLPGLILKAYSGQLSLSNITHEVQAQLDTFKKTLGFLPQYIDGHQHIQHLPVIRTALINVINKNYTHKKPYIRIASNGFLNSLLAGIKPFVIHALGTKTLRKLCAKHNVSTNTRFQGIYNLKENNGYGKLFESFLKNAGDKCIIMCHPGLDTNAECRDPIKAARINEANFFLSDDFTTLLKKYNVQL